MTAAHSGQQGRGVACRKECHHGACLNNEQGDEDFLGTDLVGQRSNHDTDQGVGDRQCTGGTGCSHGDGLGRVSGQLGGNIKAKLCLFNQGHGINTMLGDQTDNHETGKGAAEVSNPQQPELGGTLGLFIGVIADMPWEHQLLWRQQADSNLRACSRPAVLSNREQP